MIQSMIFLFSLFLCFSVYGDHDLPFEGNFFDGQEVFAVLDEELDSQEEEYEEVEFDDQGRMVIKKTIKKTRKRKTDNSDYDFIYHVSEDYSDYREHGDSHKQRRRSHRRSTPVVHPVPVPVFVPVPVPVAPPLVSNICRNGILGNGPFYCYFADGLARVVGSHCQCRIVDIYGRHLFFRGRVSIR